MAALYSVLDCVAQASMELGIAERRLSSAVTSLDQDVLQMVALLSAVAGELLMDEPYRTTLGNDVWLTDKDGNEKAFPTDDADLVLFDGRLAVDGLKFRFLKAKGLEFGEEMRDFTSRLNKLAGRANRRVLDLDSDPGRVV